MLKIQHEQQIPTLISDIYRHWRELIDELAKSFNFTHTEWQVVSKLACRGPSLTQATLCEQMSLSGPQLTRTLNRLEQNNVIERHIDKNNRRINHVHLKDPTADYVHAIESINAHIHCLISEQLNPSQKAHFIDALKCVQHITKELKEQPTTLKNSSQTEP